MTCTPFLFHSGLLLAESRHVHRRLGALGVDRALELRAVGEQDLGGREVRADGGGWPELDALAGENGTVERAADGHGPRDDLPLDRRPFANREMMLRHRNLPVEISLDREVLARQQFSNDFQAAWDDAVGSAGVHKCSFTWPDRRAGCTHARRRRFLRPRATDPTRARRPRSGRTRRSPRAAAPLPTPAPSAAPRCPPD